MRRVVVAAAVALLGFSGAQAAPVSLDSLSAVWISQTGGSNVTGIGTNEFRWGTSRDTTLGNAGLRFDVMGSPAAIETDQIFRLGELSHINPVSNGSASTSATLRFTLGINGQTQDFDFVFNIDQTDNMVPLSECGPWQRTDVACDDVITFPQALSSTVININGTNYRLLLHGFSDLREGPQLDRFVTEEHTINTTSLWAEITDRIQVLPTPSALMIFCIGLAGLALLGTGRRRSARIPL